MTDLLTATQDAVFAKLSATITDPPVYQHVPENAQPPFIVVGDISAEPGEYKGSDRITFEVDFVHRGKGRRPLLAMMQAAREALDGQLLTSVGAELSAPEWQSSDAVGADDGVTYAGLQQYALDAEPA